MPRDRERGNSLLLALIVMSALATLGSLTVVSVQSSLKASTNDRSESVANFAAESGAAAAMVYMRQYYVTHGNSFAGVEVSPTIFGNNVAPGTVGSPFSNDQNASYSVVILPSPRIAGRYVIRSTGYGPQGTTAILEWEVQWDTAWEATHPGIPNHGLMLMDWHLISL